MDRSSPGRKVGASVTACPQRSERMIRAAFSGRTRVVDTNVRGVIQPECAARDLKLARRANPAQWSNVGGSIRKRLIKRREYLDQLAPERGRVLGAEPHGLGDQQLAQNRIHEIGRGQGAAVARVRESPRRSTSSALAWPRGFASIYWSSLWI